jgi:hypothetical protein
VDAADILGEVGEAENGFARVNRILSYGISQNSIRIDYGAQGPREECWLHVSAEMCMWAICAFHCDSQSERIEGHSELECHARERPSRLSFTSLWA